MKFVIVSSRQGYGGPILLHALCKYLNQLGYDAKIFYTDVWKYDKNRKKSFWRKWCSYILRDSLKLFRAKVLKERKASLNRYIDESVRGCPRKYLPLIDSETVVIYPELMYGNPLGAKNVVRWFLYHNRFDDNAYNKDDFFICYREVFNDWRLNPKGIMLQIGYYDIDKYKRYNYGKRSGKCYVIRKGEGRNDIPKKLDGIVIDNLLEEEKVKVFNESEYCISYDTQTAYSSIAALCGCISVIIPEEGKSKADYRTEEEKDLGVAWGLDEKEILWAKETQKDILDLYISINKNGLESAKNFVEKCKERFC